MQRLYTSLGEEGFYGAFYENPNAGGRVIMAMLGDSVDDMMALTGVKWLKKQGCSVLAMSPAAKDYSHHNFPIERFGKAIDWLRKQGCTQFGVLGASTTGMLALIAASYYPEISLTVAMSPSDFVMEGYYQEDKIERPGDNESTVSWNYKPLPYLPFAYRHPEYWEQLQREAREGGNMIASREMFDLSEKLHPLQEEELIKIENIRGRVMVIGAEDDCLWDTCRYIRRMEQRLKEREHKAHWDFMCYEHGTHFVFPQSLLASALPPVSALLPLLAFKSERQHHKECKAARRDIDMKLRDALKNW